jgi:hypothetical protein
MTFAASGVVLTAAARLVQDTPRELNDDIVRPGWLGFAVFLALAGASFFLFRSMTRQIKKVDFVEEPKDRPAAASATAPDDDPPDDDPPPGI